MKAPLHILHIFSTFAVGGPQIRLIQILRGLRGELVTSIMAMDGNLAAAARISGQQVNLLPAPREGNGLSKALAIANLLRRMKPDLVATYNWGAMDAVVGVKLAGVCPFIHGEDGFGPDETLALKRRRILARRLLLRSAYRTVVPSRNLEAIARDQFGLDPKKVTYIPNGVDVARFAPGQNLEYRRARGISDDCVLFGFVGQLRKEKNLCHRGGWALLRGVETTRIRARDLSTSSLRRRHGRPVRMFSGFRCLRYVVDDRANAHLSFGSDGVRVARARDGCWGLPANSLGGVPAGRVER